MDFDRELLRSVSLTFFFCASIHLSDVRVQGLRVDCASFAVFLTWCHCQHTPMTTTPAPEIRNCACNWGKTFENNTAIEMK